MNEILRDACSNGDLKEVNRMIRLGANDFNMAMQYACRNGHLHIINRLIEVGADDLSSCLMYACECGYLDIVNRLVELREFETYVFNYALHYACYGGHLHVIDRILELGTNDYGLTEALEGACCSGNLILVKKILGLRKNYFNRGDFSKGLENAMNYEHMHIATEMMKLGARFKYHFHSMKYLNWDLMKKDIKEIFSDLLCTDIAEIIIEY